MRSPHAPLTLPFLRRVLPTVRSKTWRLRSVRLEETLDHPPHRVLFASLVYELPDHCLPRVIRIVAKVYPTADGGDRSLYALRALWAAGFKSPSRLRVPRPLAYVSTARLLLQARAPGATWSAALQSGRAASATAAARAATWLVRFQRTPVPAERLRGDADAVAARRAARELLAAFPRALARIRPVLEELADRVGARESPLVPSHGGYHPDNVLLSSRITTVVDFDKFALREAAFDVGYAIGRLLLMSYLQSGSLNLGARAATSFWRAYERAGIASRPRVNLQTARFLLQSLHFDLCDIRNGRVDLLDIWPPLIERLVYTDADVGVVLEPVLASNRSRGMPVGRAPA